MTVMAGYKAQIYVTSGDSIAFTHEACTDSGDHKKFSITNTIKRYIDPDVALLVETTTDGTTWTATTAYSVQFCGGIVTLNAALTGTPGLRVSGSYMPYSFLGNATSIDVTPSVAILDNTAFQNPPNPWKTKQSGLADGTYKLTKWWIDNFFINLLITRQRVVVAAYSGANTNQRLEGYARIKQDSIKIATNSLISEDIEFESDGPIFTILS
jgi:hypothetical protein